jgi:hypothetical protein
MSLVKKNSASLGTLEENYDRLRQSLAQIGYISQGSVLQRSVATSGRSGYQWTRKVAQKTITVSLSQPQFLAMKAAVQNERKLWKTIQQMEKVSRQILFASLPDPRRRKRLTKKVLGLIQAPFRIDPFSAAKHSPDLTPGNKRVTALHTLSEWWSRGESNP